MTTNSEWPDGTAVSLFSGAGGTDVGLERAGWRTVAATDLDRDAMTTLRANQAARIPIPGDPFHRAYLEETRLLESDVRALSPDHLRPVNAEPDWRPSLLSGGPPCQPWSSAGLQRGLDDPRGLLIAEMARLTAELRPRFVLLENVRGLMTASGQEGRPGEVLQHVQRLFEDVGYGVSWALLNAADFGVPQRRVRLYMIGSAEYALPAFPDPTHARVTQANDLRKPWVPLGEVLNAMEPAPPQDVVEPRGVNADAVRALRPGTGLKTKGRVVANRPGGHWGYRQDSFMADLGLPSRTIRAASTPDWVRIEGQVRRLTWQEAAKLQGFPSEWSFAGSAAARFRLIGNAVQADMAHLLGDLLLRQLRTAPVTSPVRSLPWPADFRRRIKYTEAEHRTNGAHRTRVKVRP